MKLGGATHTGAGLSFLFSAPAVRRPDGTLAGARTWFVACDEKALGQLIHRLFESKCSLWMTGCAKGGERSAVGKDVRLLHVHRRAVVERQRRAAKARARSCPAEAEALDFDRRQLAIGRCCECDRLLRAGPIAHGQVLFATIQYQPHRCRRTPRRWT